jgi:uncharacterized protein
MSFSLYAATIPSYIQILHSLSGLVGKAQAFCTEKTIAPEEIFEARLVQDMHPFAFQIRQAIAHSSGAIEGVRNGVFSPDRTPPPEDFAGCTSLIGQALTALDAIDPAEVDSFVGRDMRFLAGARQMEFTAENFLLSFSQPNFYFHASTAYGILRMRGVPLGKRDFLGMPRMK